MAGEKSRRNKNEGEQKRTQEGAMKLPADCRRYNRVLVDCFAGMCVQSSEGHKPTPYTVVTNWRNAT